MGDLNNRYNSKYTGLEIDQAVDNMVVYVEELPNEYASGFVAPDPKKIYILKNGDSVEYNLLYHYNNGWKQLGAEPNQITSGGSIIINNPDDDKNQDKEELKNIKINGVVYNFTTVDIMHSQYASIERNSKMLVLK